MNLHQNLEYVLEKIETAKTKSSINHRVELVAATKTRDISTIEECYKLGIKTIGENRIQEATEKFTYFHGFEKITKRFIGHLQSNKVTKCLKVFDTVDSVDSLKLAKKLNSTPKNNHNKLECLLEINTSGEPQKNGFSPNISIDLISCFSLPELKSVGLMTIGPNTKNKKQIRGAFAELRKIKEEINKEIGTDVLTELSMGMTNDYELGVQEGSTMVRLGTGLFGKREQPHW